MPRPICSRGAVAIPLDEAETVLLGLLARGSSNAQIAESLGLELQEVERRRAQLLGHLGLTTRTQLVRYALGARAALTGKRQHIASRNACTLIWRSRLWSTVCLESLGSHRMNLGGISSIISVSNPDGQVNEQPASTCRPQPQNRPDRGQQGADIIRLGEEGRRDKDLLALEALHGLVFVIARREDHFHVGLDLPQKAQRLFAAHLRHQQVQNDQRDLAGSPRKHLDALGPIGG